MKIVNLLVLSLLAVFSFACSHTNKLNQYDLNNKNIYFKQIEEPNAKEVRIEFREEELSPENPQLDVKAEAGANVISTNIEERFMEGIDADKLLDYIVINLQTSIGDEYNIKLEESVTPLTDFIIETKLTKCQLAASNIGVNITVDAVTTIIDKKSSEIIWEYSGSGVVPIQNNPIAMDKEQTSMASLLNEAQLDQLSDSQIEQSVFRAAEVVKENIIEALKEDLIRDSN